MADPDMYPASFSMVFAVRNTPMYNFASDLFCIQGLLFRYVLQPAVKLSAAPVPLPAAALIRVLCASWMPSRTSSRSANRV